MFAAWLHSYIRKFFALPLRVHLLFLVLLSVLPALGIIIHNSINHRRELEKSVTEQAESLVRTIVAKQEFITENAKQLLTTIARLPDAKSKNAKVLSEFFTELIKEGSGFINIAAGDASGNLYASALPMSSINISDRKYFKDVITKKDFSVGEFTLSRTTGVPAIHFAYPVLDRSNQIISVLVVVIDLSKFSEIIVPRTLTSDASIIVSDHNGLILYSSNGLHLLPGMKDPYYDQIATLSINTVRTARIKREKSQEFLLASSAVLLPGELEPYLFIRASFDLVSLLTQEKEYFIDSLLLLALATSLSLVVAWVLGYALIVKRLKRLVSAAQKISRGQLGFRVANTVRGAEFNSLARAFDEMAESLQSRERENKKFQEELQRSARLESLGMLAGGIAHDFNNLLMAVSANISLLKINKEKTSLEMLSGVETAIVRAKDLTLQLLTFSTGGKPLKRMCDVEKLVISTADFVLRGTHHKARINKLTNYSTVVIDEGQISQVISNLIINASQAMSEPGIITITIAKKIFTSLPTRAGNFIKIDVSDTGRGIPTEYLPKIFEPFFTTKANGHGLGLTSSHSIIKNHGGWMEVESIKEKGSTFSLYLPITTSYEQNIIIPEQEYSMNNTKRKILVMDDDETLRELIARMIRSLSHEVTVAANGEQAIELYEEALKSKAAFDAVILDLTVRAGMGGKETMRILQAEHPEIRAIAASGFTTDDVMANYQKYGFSSRLAKPFRIEELQRTIQIVCN